MEVKTAVLVVVAATVVWAPFAFVVVVVTLALVEVVLALVEVVFAFTVVVFALEEVVATLGFFWVAVLVVWTVVPLACFLTALVVVGCVTL